MKKLISLTLAVIMSLGLFAAIVPAASAENVKPRLYNVYGSFMLLQQNEKATFNGTANPASEIAVFLYDGENVVTYGKAQTNRSGEFSVSFDAPGGGFKEYTVALTENGERFATLTNVVFGEVWLASGQSNMQYSLGTGFGSSELFNSGSLASYWLRALIVPAPPLYDGSAEKSPFDPQKEIPGCFWTNGESEAIYGMSAVAYYFAEKLMNDIDMPVGIISSSLGGSKIATWLPYDAVEADTALKNEFKAEGLWLDGSVWKGTEDRYSDLYCNYNVQIAPVTPFKIAGMIWYQGESDMLHYKYLSYTDEFDLMQRAYTEKFNYEDGLLPIVWTQLATFWYGDKQDVCDMNIEFSQIQSLEPDSRALVSITDVPLDFLRELGFIHPATKAPVGQRMAYCAEGLVYGTNDCHSSPAAKEISYDGDSVTVTFENAGDALVCTDKRISGFALAGEDGIYSEAEAEIISADTVKVSSGSVAEPFGITYAYSLNNTDANLYASEDGEATLPVCAFKDSKTEDKHYFASSAWLDCESDKVFRVTSDNSFCAYADVFSSKNCEIKAAAADAYSGNAGLNITSDGKGCFTLNAPLSYSDGVFTTAYDEAETDYSDYASMSVMVRNNSGKDITLEKVRFHKNALIFYSPLILGEKDNACVIPADGQWHEIVFDLNSVCLEGNECGTFHGNEKLTNIKNIVFEFSSSSAANLSFDCVRFASDGGERVKAVFEAHSHDADNLFELISCIIVGFLHIFASIFGVPSCI